MPMTSRELVQRALGLDSRFQALRGQVMEFILGAWILDSRHYAGVQVLNLQQPRIFDLAELGRRFAGAVCFNVPVDIQTTMPRGSLAEIREEARLLLHHLATERGGFIANEHTDYVGNGIDPVKGVWAYEAFRDADPYRPSTGSGRIEAAPQRPA